MGLRTLKQIAVLPLISAMLVACGGDDDDDDTPRITAPDPVVEPQPQPQPEPQPQPSQVQLQISLTNLTAGQPQTPAAVIVHRSGYLAFDEGEAASVELEDLAESGSPQALLTAAGTNDAVLKTYAGPAVVAPGGNRTFTMTIDGVSSTEGLYLTGLTMLANTNDAFTGVNNVSLGNMAVGDSMRWNGPVWDAGTEANTETAATMPGPAAGGEGTNAARDDILNKVTFHQGVITSDQGLATSALNNSHRFDQPAVAIRVTRLQ
ncbi:spondin domain-containing protein [Bacterioplanoides sp. SCSIO 12839]|uniref:spondin domain-containing protein n=1 Tax=Bacterioplanoides sp. SCSIO 12839 TaxID=2829569 RepID=UPI00210342AE|nr:spondin domain-containing protein [Bacterioplanoides sp. SCSIO 12839]UTW48413.1 spondin domain-containing protein [Bacterioplanoides sp. SCSIO 12839]